MSPSLSGTPPSGSASTPPSARNLSSCWRLEALVSRPSIVSSFRLRRNPPPPALRSASRVASVSNSVASSGLSGSKLARSADALTLDGDPPGIVGAGLATPRPKPPAASAYPTFAAAAARLAAVDGGGGGAIARDARSTSTCLPYAPMLMVSARGVHAQVTNKDPDVNCACAWPCAPRQVGLWGASAENWYWRGAGS